MILQCSVPFEIFTYFGTVPLSPDSQVHASQRKLSTCVQLTFRLAAHFALTCVDFGRGPIFVRKSTHGFHRPSDNPTQVDASWSRVICMWREIYDFLRLVWTCESTCESVWPPIASPYASPGCVNLCRLVSTCVESVWVRLTSALEIAYLFLRNLTIFVHIPCKKYPPVFREGPRAQCLSVLFTPFVVGTSLFTIY